MVTTHVGDYGHLGVNNVGGVEAAQQSHLDQCRVDGLATEPQESGCGQQLKVAWWLWSCLRVVGYPADEVTKLVLGDHLASKRQAFTDGVDVRAEVLADPEAVGCQQAAGHTNHRTLTVGAGDVDSP